MGKQNRSSRSSERKLAAIMFTDIAGYTTLMGKDESLALKLLKINRDIQRSLIKKHHGRWLKEMGDGILASFSSISDAVYCAGEIMASVSDVQDLNLRIGIHLGEVVEENNDVFGDGVNIASRIEALTTPGSIWVSEAVYRNLRNKPGIEAIFEQTVELKNVEDPLNVYSVKIEPGNQVKDQWLQATEVNNPRWIKPALIIGVVVIILSIIGLLWNAGYFNSRTAVLERSIAILPFENLSSDEGNAHFAIGIQEAILNHLSKFEDLRVISRSSMEQYRDSKQSVPQIAREVGVNFILEGSVQKAEDKVRVTVQLINGTNDDHIWAENYDRNIEEIFVVQSEIAQSIAQELKAIFNPEVIEVIERVPTRNMEAYEYFLRGLEVHETAKEVNDIKRAGYLYQKAIEIDPGYPDPYLGLARIYADLHWRLDNHQEVMDTVMSIVNKAIELDPQNSDAWSYKGWYTFYGLNDLEEAEKYFAKAIQLNPNNADVYFILARWVYPDAEEPDLVKSIMYAKKAARLIKGERLGELYDGIGYIYLSVGMYEEAERFYQLSSEIMPNWQANSALWWLNMIQGKFNDALVYARKNVDLYPDNNRSYLELARTFAHMEQYDTALVVFDTWHSMYREDLLDRWEYNTFSDEYKYALIKSGKDPKKGYEQVRDKIDFLYGAFEKDIFNFAGGWYYDMVRLNTIIGNNEEAIKYLLKIEDAGYAFGSISWAMVDPLLEDLRDEPEFIASIERGWNNKWDIQEKILKMEAEEELITLRKR